MCVDSRGINKIIVKNMFPTPRLDMLGELPGVKWFSKINLHSGYYHIWIRPENEWKAPLRQKIDFMSG